MSGLANQIALVTGATRGIGAAIAAELKAQGATVIGTATSQAGADTISATGVRGVVLNVTDGAAVDALIDSIVKEHGGLHILVNNAGVMHVNGILTATSAELAGDIEVNYYGTLRVIQTFAPLIEKNGGGVIANVLSVLALAPMAPVAGYSVSKAALHSATQAARGALKAKNIKVVGIFPGPIDTELSSGLPIDKTSPDVAAKAIVQGFIDDLEDIYPDPVSQQVSGFWGSNPKGLEHHFASL